MMSSEPLISASCDLLKDENGKAHHSEDYETVSARLVVRRGQVFRLRVTFNRDTNFPTDQLKFELHMGRSPRTNHKSRIHLLDVDPGAGDQSSVGVKYSRINTGNSLVLEVFTSSDMGAGQWRLVMYHRRRTSRRRVMSIVAENIVVLFNPWNKDDDVYMKNDEWRNEYVMNDTGRQYYGSARRIGGMNWYFGQFEKEVLDAVLHILDMGPLRYRDHSSAVAVSRHFSALVNSNDDDGVLVGNWSGEYDDGTSPSDWIGSYAILKQYFEKKEPVQYGQCWVFAGVLCTALRAIGIPARCVTNFESAHDTDANLTIDYLYDKNDKSLDNDDSIWNFHVWNDVWMARPDLPKGFGGWQALDATPQEESSGVMRCGPMSLDAIKQGLIFHNYDGPFIYAEVNGTKRHWRRIAADKWEEIHSEERSVGKHISTKRVGSDLREDITSQYKFPEDSPQADLAFKIARKYVKFTKSERVASADVVKFEADVPDSVAIGDDIVVSFKITSVDSVARDVYIGIVAKVMQYNGAIVSKLHNDSSNFTLAAGESKTIKATLKGSLYLPKTRHTNNSIKLFVLGGVKKPTGGVLQSFAFNDSVELDKPTLSVTVASTSVKVGESVKVTVAFTNPFSQKLPAGKLRIEGSGIVGVLELSVPSIGAKAKFSKTITAVPKRFGSRMIIAGYASSVLNGVQGSVILNVSS